MYLETSKFLGDGGLLACDDVKIYCTERRVSGPSNVNGRPGSNEDHGCLDTSTKGMLHCCTKIGVGIGELERRNEGNERLSLYAAPGDGVMSG
jgi:hypothetical protein